jgi:hypothetical protein
MTSTIRVARPIQIQGVDEVKVARGCRVGLVCVIQRGDGRAAAAGTREKPGTAQEREGRRDAGNFTWRTHNKRTRGACFTGLQTATTSKETLVIQVHGPCRCIEDRET